MSQAQSPRSKKPLDVLQGMINLILIETGKALRASDKEGTRSMGPAHLRLRSTIPSAMANFHQALDELECDIARAKSVLGRDLEQLRAQRYAAENPSTQISDDTMQVDLLEPAESVQAPNAVMAPSQPSPQPQIKEESATSRSPPKVQPLADQPTPKDPPKDSIATVSEDKKIPSVPSPQTSKETNPKADVIGLGIDTSGAADSQAPAPSTGERHDSTIDSLFGDLTEGNDIDNNNNENTNADTDLNFDDMDFTIHDSNQDSNANTQNPEQAQTQNHEFDISSFGDPTHGNDDNLDFNMTDLQPSNDTNSGDDKTNKQDDLTDIFGNLDDNTAGDPFEDMFFGTGDDSGMGDGGMGEMEHGEFDNAFFGLAN